MGMLFHFLLWTRSQSEHVIFQLIQIQNGWNHCLLYFFYLCPFYLKKKHGTQVQLQRIMFCSWKCMYMCWFVSFFINTTHNQKKMLHSNRYWETQEMVFLFRRNAKKVFFVCVVVNDRPFVLSRWFYYVLQRNVAQPWASRTDSVEKPHLHFANQPKYLFGWISLRVWVEKKGFKLERMLVWPWLPRKHVAEWRQTTERTENEREVRRGSKTQNSSSGCHVLYP